MSELLPQLATAFGLGLLGSGHCLGMCGDIAAATGSGDKNYSVYFNVGRISSYALIGLLLGGLTQVISANLAPMMLVFRASLWTRHPTGNAWYRLVWCKASAIYAQ